MLFSAPVDSAPTADPSSAASAPAPLTVPPSMPGLSGLPGLTPATPSSAAAKPPAGAEDLKKRMPAAPVPTPPVAPPLASTATAPPQTGAEPGAEPKAAVAAPAQPEESKDGQAPTGVSFVSAFALSDSPVAFRSFFLATGTFPIRPRWHQGVCWGVYKLTAFHAN